MLASSRRCTALVVGAFLLALAPSHASACGGLFCDRGGGIPDAFGNPPPVQSGEEIVYGVESDGSVVMTVRIYYQGTAPEFAWLLPVPAVPTISLGTDALFAALDPPTQPRFVIEGSSQFGSCMADPACDYFGFADAGFAASDVGADGEGGPTVELMSTLGPYETVVLSGSTGADVQSWLSMHGYVIPAASIPLLDDYASHGSHFVALRLRADASADQIQPITLTMSGVSPCLPIRLTALATQPDLPITAWFLGEGRAVSMNYSMVDPAYTDIGLYRGTTSYYSYVTHQVDAFGGQAFVTDYSGATPPTSLVLLSVLDLATATDPSVFLYALNTRGYLSDTHILSILADYLMPPSGMTARLFYDCLVFRGTGCGTPTYYDPVGLATAIDQTITRPRLDAQALVTRHRFTTRLYTTMSAEEMTLDPEFRLDPALSSVSALRVASPTVICDGALYSDEAAGYYTTQYGVQFADFPAQPHGTAEQWCARHGGRLRYDAGRSSLDADRSLDAARTWLDGGHYPDGAVAPPAPLVASGGCGCGVHGRGHGAWAALVFVLALRARRRR